MPHRSPPHRGRDTALNIDGHLARLHPLVLRYAYPQWFLPYVELEAAANSMRVFESQIVPGLLQIEDYARAMLTAVRPDHVGDLVAARMSRKGVFEREDRPFTWFIIVEQALDRPLGDSSTMVEQMRCLLHAGEEPRTVIQVVPKHVAAHPGLAGPFTVLSFSENPDVLYVDGFSQGRMGLDVTEVAGAIRAYDLLRAVALSHEDSADRIGVYLKRYQDE